MLSSLTRPAAVYLVSDIPGGLQVRLSLEVVDRLNMRVLEAFKAVPRRGLEVGGLLLGRLEPDAVVVDGFEEVPSEHERGPSYWLSEADHRLMKRKIAARRGFLGFYRSHTREGFALDEEDAALLAAFQPPLFLLLKPATGSYPIAAFFGADGAQAGEPFPFHRGQLLAGDHRLAEPEKARGASPAGRRARWPLGAMAAAAFLLLAILLVPRAKPPGPPAPQRTPLTLEVELGSDSLALKWNSAAPSVQGATRGTLWIQDGGREEQIELSKGDLTGGRIVYRPKSADVRFRLEVAGAERVTESVRAIGFQPPAPAASVPLAKAPVRAPPARARPARKTRPTGRKAVVRPETRPFTSASPPRVTERIDLPEPPPSGPAAGPATSGIPTTPPGPPRMERTAVQRAVVSVEAAGRSPVTRAIGKVPLVGRLVDRKAPELPRVLRRVAPVIPADLREPVRVDVKVHLGDNGRVRYAELLSDAAGNHDRLIADTVYAARLWEFEPTRQREVVLRFRYDPQGRE